MDSNNESLIPEGREPALTEEQKKKLEELIEEEEGVTRKITGFWQIVITALAVGMSLFAIYSAIQPVTTQILRSVHVAFLLAICFLYYPIAKKSLIYMRMQLLFYWLDKASQRSRASMRAASISASRACRAKARALSWA